MPESMNHFVYRFLALLLDEFQPAHRLAAIPDDQKVYCSLAKLRKLFRCSTTDLSSWHTVWNLKKQRDDEELKWKGYLSDGASTVAFFCTLKCWGIMPINRKGRWNVPFGVWSDTVIAHSNQYTVFMLVLVLALRIIFLPQQGKIPKKGKNIKIPFPFCSPLFYF